MAECAAQASSEVEFASFPDEDGVETTPPPLTAQQAQQWRKNHRSLSLTGTLLMQMTVGAFVSLLVWVLTQSRSAAGSAAYGSAAVVLPAALFAFGTTGLWRPQTPLAGVSLLRLFVWEGAKIALTVAMLCMAPRLLGSQLDWLALLAGFVLVIKSYWLSLWWQSARRKAMS